MTGVIDGRLSELKIALPAPPAVAGAYVPFVIAGDLVFISGQLPLLDGVLRYPGRLGETLTTEEGAAAARLCALNLLAQLRAACDGDLDRVGGVVRLGGFVACTPEFSQQPQVLNGASELMAAVFGEAGRHARFAVGAPALPLGAAVEVEGIFRRL
jgi:enamine deaminase RidA (YjgF/YER057c/UK114 family)